MYSPNTAKYVSFFFFPNQPFTYTYTLHMYIHMHTYPFIYIHTHKKNITHICVYIIYTFIYIITHIHLLVINESGYLRRGATVVPVGSQFPGRLMMMEAISKEALRRNMRMFTDPIAILYGLSFKRLRGTRLLRLVKGIVHSC